MILLNEFLGKMNLFEGLFACLAQCFYQCTCFIQTGSKIVGVQKSVGPIHPSCNAPNADEIFIHLSR